MGKLSLHVFLTAERLEVSFGDCIVIEVAVSRVTAAKRAGVHCQAFDSINHGYSLTEADLVVNTFEAVSI